MNNIITFCHHSEERDSCEIIWVCYDGIKQFAPQLAPIVEHLKRFDVLVSTVLFDDYDIKINGEKLYDEMAYFEFRNILELLGFDTELMSHCDLYDLAEGTTFYFKLLTKAPRRKQ